MSIEKNLRNCPNCKESKKITEFYKYRSICKKCYYLKQEERRKKKNKTIPREKYKQLEDKYKELEKKYKELEKKYNNIKKENV